MVDDADLPPMRPTIANLRTRINAARAAVYKFSTESQTLWTGARQSYAAIPFAKRAAYLAALEADLAPFLELPELLQNACEKRDRLRKDAASTSEEREKK